jgi:CheY-like chemotaxis protein
MPSQDRSVVLLVEDEPLVRLVTAELLAESGLRVIEAVNAAEALAVLESGLRVEVVLSDIEMPPGPDGFALARQIRKCWPKVEVLLTSGRQWPREGDLPPGVAFLAKPCPTEILVQHVAAAADRARAVSAETSAAKILPFPKSA